VHIGIVNMFIGTHTHLLLTLTKERLMVNFVVEMNVEYGGRKLKR
jgi:hypothetical protein